MPATPKLTAAETEAAIRRYAGDRNRAAVYRVTAYAEQESAYGVAQGFGDVARLGRNLLASLA